MANYLIYACEQHYGGLHGMYTYDVQYGISEKVAHEYGHDMSIEVMESYSSIMDDIEADAEQAAMDEGIAYDTVSENEYDDWMCNAISELEEENAEWSVYKLRDNLTQEDKEQISILMHRNDWEEIVKQYSEEQSFAIVL